LFAHPDCDAALILGQDYRSLRLDWDYRTDLPDM